MVQFFLSSHGHLASGLKSSVGVLLGGCDRLTVFDAYVDERSLEDALNAFYQQVILLSDMYGGSVNSIMYTFLNRPNTTLIAGVNLALVIGLVIQDRELTREEIEDVVRQSREAIQIVELDNAQQSEGDEDLF